MSSSSFAALTEVRLAPSGRALILLFWIHVALVGLGFVVIHQTALGVAYAGLLGLDWWWLRRHRAFGHGPRAIAAVRRDAAGQWFLANPAGREWAVDLDPDTVIWPTLVVLRLRMPDKRLVARVLLGDEAAPEDLRRLRVALLEQRDAKAGVAD